jgi:hypothetical protein
LSPPEDIVSAELKRRKQGKARFDFAKPDEKLFTELAELTRLGFEGWQRGICTGSTDRVLT